MADVLKFPGGQKIKQSTELTQVNQCKEQILEYWNKRDEHPYVIQAAVAQWVGYYQDELSGHYGNDWTLIADEVTAKVRSAGERKLSPVAVVEEISSYFRSLGLDPESQ